MLISKLICYRANDMKPRRNVFHFLVLEKLRACFAVCMYVLKLSMYNFQSDTFLSTKIFIPYIS